VGEFAGKPLYEAPMGSSLKNEFEAAGMPEPKPAIFSIRDPGWVNPDGTAGDNVERIVGYIRAGSEHHANQMVKTLIKQGKIAEDSFANITAPNQYLPTGINSGRPIIDIKAVPEGQ
jgi:hypothetical protein